MIKRINRTGRKRIKREDIEIAIRPAEAGRAPIFDITLALDEYGFPADARVRVEAARSNAFQRWSFGTVGDMTLPTEEERRMTDVAAGSKFRIFVVASDGSGKLLGHAANIKPKHSLDSLLPLEERDDLGKEVWRVDFDEKGDGSPVLQVNRAIDGISESVRSDSVFRSLVMPAVFRAILTRMVLIDEASADDEDGPWADWFLTAQAYYSDGEPPALNELASTDDRDNRRAEALDWIEDVIRAFAEKPLDASGAYAAALEKERA